MRYSCGTVASADGQDEEVFSDQLCVVCGHAPCPSCATWCDVVGVPVPEVVGGRVHSVVRAGEDGGPEALDAWGYPAFAECCSGECTYETPPAFTRKDGSPWLNPETTRSA